MGKSFWGSIVSMGVGLAISGCSSHAAVHDAGMLRDAPPTGFDAGPPAMDSGMVGIGNAYIRLVNLIPASPNLTVCIATIPGTGIAATTAHIIGQPDARLMSNGTLPYPGISPYLPAPIFDTPGFGYELRLYDQAAVPFVALGPCPAAGAQPAPIATIHATASSVMVNKHYSAVLIGVVVGLSLIAAVVAEFAAGSAGKGSGLAFRLLESGYRLNYPRLYAALVLLMLTGVAIFAITSFISWLLLHRWHESALKREN